LPEESVHVIMPDMGSGYWAASIKATPRWKPPILAKGRAGRSSELDARRGTEWAYFARAR